MTILVCSAEACWVTAAGQPGEAVCGTSWPGVHRPWRPGVAGGLMAQLVWGAGDVAIEVMGLLLLKLSEALRWENMARASGKLGGVAGVLAGVHIWKSKNTTNLKSAWKWNVVISLFSPYCDAYLSESFGNKKKKCRAGLSSFGNLIVGRWVWLTNSWRKQMFWLGLRVHMNSKKW